MFFFYSLYISIGIGINQYMLHISIGRYAKNPYRHSPVEHLSNFLILINLNYSICQQVTHK